MHQLCAIARLLRLPALAMVCLAVTATTAVASTNGTTGICVAATHTTCTYSTVGSDTFTVPAGVTRLWVTAIGGGGGAGSARGGSGATVTSSYVAVTPGAVISLFVGGGGQNGTPGNGFGNSQPEPQYTTGGGGGGATTVELSATNWIIAGGGGGGGFSGGGGGVSDGTGGSGGAGGQAAGGDGSLAGYSNRCAGRGGQANGTGGWPAITDYDSPAASQHCNAGIGSAGIGQAAGPMGAGKGGDGARPQDGAWGALGGSGLSASNGIGGSGSYRWFDSFLMSPSALATGGGGGYGGGGSGAFGSGAGAGSSLGPSGGGTTTTYSASAGNGGDSGAITPAAGNGSVTVAYATQTQSISFTSTPSSAVVNAVYTPAATGGGSGQAVTLAIDDSSSGVCTLTAGIVTFDHVGTCVINANQVGTIDYREAPQVQQTIIVGKANQTIAFATSPPASDPVYGTSAYYQPTVTASTLNAGTSITWAIDPASTSGCSIDSVPNVLFYGNAGTCIINVNRPGNADYNAAPQVQQTVNVAKAPQTVTFTSTAPSPAYGSGQTYTPTASGGASGNARTFTIDATSSGICTMSGGVVSFQDYGRCLINANQAGNGNYLAATQVQQTVIVRRPQTVSITQIASPTPRVGTTVTLSATGGGSGNPIIFRARPANICTVVGDQLSIVGYATCFVTGTQAGDADYDAAPGFDAGYEWQAVEMSFLTRPGSQTITYTSSAPSAVVGDTYSPTATGGATNNPVTFGLTALSSSICTMNGSGVIRFDHPGTCNIYASQAGSPLDAYLYDPAPTTYQAITVSKAPQVLAFSGPAPTPTYGDGASYTPAATGGVSGNPIAFTIDASATAVCTITGGIVTFQHAGDCVINANQDGNDDYLAAVQIQRTIIVAKADQAITFTTPAPTPTYGDASTYTPAASGGASGNARSFTIDPSSSGSCAITNGTVTFLNAGTCTLNANQAGTADYNPAPEIQQTVTVARAPQVVAFTTTPGATIVDGSYAPAASSGGSGNSVVFTSATPSVCSVSTGVVTFLHVGTCTLNADQAEASNYLAAPRVQQTMEVARAPQIMAFSTTPVGTAVDATYTPAAGGGGSASPVIIAVDGASSGVCTRNPASGVVTFEHVGACVLRATKAGTVDYEAGETTQTITVVQAPQVVDFTTLPLGGVVDATYTPTLTGGRSGSPIVVTSAAPAVCTVTGGIVTFNHVGSCVLSGNQAGTTDYLAAVQVQQTITVSQAAQTLAFTSVAPSPNAFTTERYTPTFTHGRSGEPVVRSVDGGARSSCSLDGTAIAFAGAGTCVITLAQDGTADYFAAAPVTQEIIVTKAPQLVTFTSIAPSPVFGTAATYAPAATGGATGNPVTFAIAAGATGVCTLTAGVVSFDHAGDCIIEATQDGDADYFQGRHTATITVAKAPQTVTFTSTAPSTVTVGDAAYVPAAVGGASGNPVTFEIAPAASGACALSGGAVNFTGAGSCVILAAQAGTADYGEGRATQTIAVNAPAPVTPPAAVVSATPTAAGTATIGGTSLSWPARAFSRPVTVTLEAAPAGTANFVGGQAIRLLITDAAGQPVTSFSKPLELIFPAAAGIPGFSRNGKAWVAIPRITGPRLPNGYADGWFAAADGSIHVLTTHATDFGILAKGTKIAPALRLTAVSTKRQGAKLTVRVATSLPARIQVRLQGASATAARTSSTSLTLRIPAQCTKKACTLVVRATAGGETAARTVRVR